MAVALVNQAAQKSNAGTPKYTTPSYWLKRLVKVYTSRAASVRLDPCSCHFHARMDPEHARTRSAGPDQPFKVEGKWEI